MQRMVAAGAREVPREGATHKSIGTCSRRQVRRALRYKDWWLVGVGLAVSEDTVGEAAGLSAPGAAPSRVRGVCTHLGLNRVGVQTDLQMVRLRTDITHLKHQVLGDLPFHRKAPVLDGGRAQGRIQLAGLEDRAIHAPRWATTGRRWRCVAERNGT